MQQARTAHLPAVTTASGVVVQAVLAMALGLFIVGVVGFSHITPFTTPLTMSATPMPFPVTDVRCLFSDLLYFRPRWLG